VFRLLGLLGGLSVAMDLGTGSADDESLKRSLVAARFARSLGCSADEVSAAIYTALLQHLGCTAYSHELAHTFGDDITATRFAFLTDLEDPRDLLRTWVPGVAAGAGRSRARVLATAVIAGRKVDAAGPPATCEVARDAARRLGLPEPVREGVHSAITQWNGKGFPPVKGDEIPLCSRIMQVASTAVMFELHAGRDTALDQVRQRAGSYLDPELVDAFDPILLDGLDEEDAYDLVLDAEPDPVRWVEDEHLATVARTFGDLVDLKSPTLHGHSCAVGDLAYDAAMALHLDEAERLRVAGYLHDLGRIAVSSRVWDKGGRLTANERDQVELHPHYSERILSRIPALRDVARLAGQHHERCDGSGYPRGLNAAATSLPARVLAAADSYRNLVEARPYRSALSPAEAATRLGDEVRRGRLDGDAVTAVLEAAGHRTGSRRPHPAGLTERQVEVLRLLASGLSNREIAGRLVISSRTAERHVQDVYEKIGLNTRAGAALFAMEHGLVHGTKDA